MTRNHELRPVFGQKIESPGELHEEVEQDLANFLGRFGFVYPRQYLCLHTKRQPPQESIAILESFVESRSRSARSTCHFAHRDGVNSIGIEQEQGRLDDRLF